MQVNIRPILVHEIGQLKQIALKTFIDSYERLNTPSEFQKYISSAFTVEKLSAEMKNEESAYYFVLAENKIIGYLKLNIGNSQTEDFSDDYLEIERIYLDTNYHRKGIGKTLIEFALEKGKELQKTKVWLGVWDQNPKAILFYERMGFVKIGNHVFKFGNEDQVDILMEMDIPS